MWLWFVIDYVLCDDWNHSHLLVLTTIRCSDSTILTIYFVSDSSPLLSSTRSMTSHASLCFSTLGILRTRTDSNDDAIVCIPRTLDGLPLWALDAWDDRIPTTGRELDGSLSRIVDFAMAFTIGKDMDVHIFFPVPAGFLSFCSRPTPFISDFLGPRK